MTVLAPSTRAADLLAGRRALLNGGDNEVVALGPAIPVSRRSRDGRACRCPGQPDAGPQPRRLRRRPWLRAGPAEPLVPRPPRRARARRRDVLLARAARLPARESAARKPARPDRRADRDLGGDRRGRGRPLPGRTACSGQESTRSCSNRAKKRRLVVSEWRPGERALARAVSRALRELPDWSLVLLRTKPLAGRPTVSRGAARPTHVRTRERGLRVRRS